MKLKLVTLIAIAGLSMGNQSCEEKSTARQLKMDVSIGVLGARKVTMPTGEVIDFPYVANTLFYRQVMDHDHFVISGPVPTATTYAAQGGQFKVSQAKASSTSSSTATSTEEDAGLLAARDVSALDQYGFLNATRTDGKGLLTGALKTEDVMTGKSLSTAAAALPACLYELPRMELGGDVISFEATWGVGLGVGYGAGGDLAGKVGGSVDFSQSQLQIGLKVDDPLSRETLSIGDGVSNKSAVKFGIDFSTGLPIGLNFFFNTPIADVIRSAMTKGLDNVVNKYTKDWTLTGQWNDAWESRVIYDPVLVNGDTHVAFRGGARAGVKIGDKFTLTNLHYMWEGAACYTRLKYRIPATTTPIAEGTVVTVGDNVSVAIVKYLQEARVEPGAQVKVLKLVEPVATKTAAK